MNKTREKSNYPVTKQVKVTENLHGVEIIDNYQWLEDHKDPEVINWTMEQEKLARGLIDKLPQRAWVMKRLNELMRYDDRGIPRKVLKGDRIFLKKKKKNDEHWVYFTKESDSSPEVELLNPNLWGHHDSLEFTEPSNDGKYLAFGTAKGGDENPVIQVMEVATKKILPDSLKGWKQHAVSWLPDNSGFYYSACPLKGEVKEEEEYYWNTCFMHRLGTSKQEDEKVFFHEKIKEYYHHAFVSEDGKYVIFYRSQFNKNEVYIKKSDSADSPEPVVTGFDALYNVHSIEEKLIIMTDWNAPNGIVYMTSVERPQRENWKVFIPEHKDNLLGFDAVGGHLYAIYSHNACTLIKIYSPEGEFLRELPLPSVLGSASLSGHWAKPEVWVVFESFDYPNTILKYDYENNKYEIYHQIPVTLDISMFETEQIWYTSKDGTKISMFLIHSKNLKKDGNNPVILTGYGGFNIPIAPMFSFFKMVWLECGGMIAVPNLRGGGEYGREWHKAGMHEKKQNVFDDFIAAGEWLIENRYTNQKKLVISGGSNGGLLVGAAAVQRPDLWKAVECAVPLLDMIRYHKFGIGNLWAEEFGSPENPEEFKYILKYSPYHNVVNGIKYPPFLLTASENDARVIPAHAAKMAARLQEADPGGTHPVMLIVRRQAGHGGGTRLAEHIEEFADSISFLMDQTGMTIPV